jgi:hypothetical protein
LDKRYADSYALYAQRFVAALESVADELNLPLPPQVLVDDDPRSARWDEGAVRNSGGVDAVLVSELWERAHAVVPLPNVDIRCDQPDPMKGG